MVDTLLNTEVSALVLMARPVRLARLVLMGWGRELLPPSFPLYHLPAVGRGRCNFLLSAGRLPPPTPLPPRLSPNGLLRGLRVSEGRKEALPLQGARESNGDSDDPPGLASRSRILVFFQVGAERGALL
jgi:hypothetical protein